MIILFFFASWAINKDDCFCQLSNQQRWLFFCQFSNQQKWLLHESAVQSCLLSSTARWLLQKIDHGVEPIRTEPGADWEGTWIKTVAWDTWLSSRCCSGNLLLYVWIDFFFPECGNPFVAHISKFCILGKNSIPTVEAVNKVFKWICFTDYVTSPIEWVTMLQFESNIVY